MSRMPDGPPPPLAVQRLRLRYAKRGRLRFASHRDFQRALERALRSANVPMAYSAGFTPHPKISYANAAPTGAASEAEYVEIAVTRRCDPERLRADLDAALPPGLDVLEIVEAGPGGLVERLEASVWSARMAGVSTAEASAAARELLAAPSVLVQRLTKTGLRTLDARSAVVRLQVTDGDSSPQVNAVPGGCAILQMVVRHTTPAVRPDDVLAALRAVADFAPPSPPLVTRLAQGPLNEADGTVADPLTADRDIAGT